MYGPEIDNRAGNWLLGIALWLTFLSWAPELMIVLTIVVLTFMAARGLLRLICRLARDAFRFLVFG
jgi:hypothetical protein